MNIKPVFFIDLDDTIFQTARKLRPDLNSVPASVDRMGQPSSWMTPVQKNFFSWLKRHAVVIPVTGRGPDQLQRVRLSFDSWKIASHGAIIIQPDGKLHEPEFRRLAQELRAFREPLLQIKILCETFYEKNGFAVGVHICRHGEIPLYLVAKHQAPEKVDELYALRAQLAAKEIQAKFNVHANSNNLSIIPKIFDKKRAVKKVLDLIGKEAQPILGMGDSLSDLGFMSLGHWLIFPCHSQIADHLFKNI